MAHHLSAARLALLVHLQRESFAYFLHTVNPANGLVRDKTAADAPASIAAVGMALTVYPIGVERGFMTRAHASDLTLAALRFFATSDQGTAADATGYKGFYYHFLDMDTGRRAWNCELSSIDTALLMAGVLTAAAYFGGAPQLRFTSTVNYLDYFDFTYILHRNTRSDDQLIIPVEGVKQPVK